MSQPIKKYIITAITLAAIGAASAALIGAVNLVTKDRIELNAANKIKKGLAQIYGDNATFSDQIAINGDDKYLDCYYIAKVDDNQVGYIFQTSGKNMYGAISMLVGISNEFEINRFYLITNEQTYNTTLVDNYVDPFNSGDVKLDDVTCGATYGAKLVRAMAQEASDWAKANLGGGQ